MAQYSWYYWSNHSQTGHYKIQQELWTDVLNEGAPHPFKAPWMPHREFLQVEHEMQKERMARTAAYYPPVTWHGDYI